MPKKILYLITQSEQGGAQRYIFDLANGLKQDFDIFVAYGEPGETGWLAEQLSQKNIPHYHLHHLKRAISPINDLLALFEIIKLIIKIKPDIIHLNSSKISILGSIAGRVSRIAYRASRVTTYTVHGWVFNEPLPTWQKAFYFWAEKFTARWKNKLICVSEFDRRVAIDRKIAPGEKLVTIHNGIKQIKFFPREEAENFLNSKIQNGKTLIAGAMGNLYKTKGYEYMIRAAGLVIKEKPETKFIIIGDGAERMNLEAMIAKYNLENNFFLLGQINNASKLLPAFDIYVNSSVKEGLSYTLIEAMQAGLPIVATAVGGTPELIENNKTGLLVTPAQPDNLAKAIIHLINDRELRSKIGNSAKQRATTDYTLEQMIFKTKELYK